MKQSAPVAGWPYFDGITTENNGYYPNDNFTKENQCTIKQEEVNMV